MKNKSLNYLALVGVLFAQNLVANDTQDLAKKLANPVSSIISVPIQANYQPNLGLNDEGSKWLINVQPVIPFNLNDEWNLITRTIVPLVSQDTGIPGVDTINGIGDVLFTAWASPNEKTENGWLIGIGGAFLIPTDSDVSAKKWGAGPSAIALKQDGHLTYGALVNHVWSYAGSDSIVENISATFVQPFFAYVTDNAMTFSLNTESTYDWEVKEWTVPLNMQVSKLLHIGRLPVSLGAGLTYWAQAPDNGPEGWGTRLIMTFILPK